MNVLTIDLEEWFHLCDPKRTYRPGIWDAYDLRSERIVDRLLALFDERSTKATFFCLGWLSERRPELIRRIADQGHEVGSHSYAHDLLFLQDPSSFQRDVERSVGVLESITGRKVRAYRAPSFSLTPRTPWAIESLLQVGIENDASVFPVLRFHGGHASAPSDAPFYLECRGMRLKEFPVSVCRLGPFGMAVTGGGYFRIIPYAVIRRHMARSSYTMAYFHPRDFDEGQPLMPGLSPLARVRAYVGIRGAFQKVQGLIREFSFCSVAEADRNMAWEGVKTIYC